MRILTPYGTLSRQKKGRVRSRAIFTPLRQTDAILSPKNTGSGRRRNWPF